MLRLNMKKEPFWLNLVGGVRLQARPLTTAVMSAAQAAVIKRIATMRDAGEILDEDTRAGFTEALLIQALARFAIVAWEGVLQAENDDLAPVTEQAIDELMSIWFVAQDFWKQYTATLSMLETEGNASRPASHGISPAGQITAEDATSKTSHAATDTVTK